MSTVQVLQHEPNQAAQMLSQAGNDISDTLYKQQSLKLTGQYYKVLAKNAQTEQDKAKLERLAKLNSDILPQIAGTQDPAKKSMLMKAVVDSGLYGGDANTFFKDMAESQKITQDHHDSVNPNSQPNQDFQMNNVQQPSDPSRLNISASPAMPAPAIQDTTSIGQPPANTYMTPGEVAAQTADYQKSEAEKNRFLVKNPQYLQPNIDLSGLSNASQALTAARGERNLWQNILGTPTATEKVASKYMSNKLNSANSRISAITGNSPAVLNSVMEDKIQRAKAAGYSDKEIQEYLNGK